MKQVDVAVIGGGIIGLATAFKIQSARSGTRVVVVEKESQVATHQSGRNSGVLHSGIYYTPGTLKAEMCRRGNLAMRDFCQEQEIPFDVCGKVIVAVEQAQLPRLKELFERGLENQVSCRLIDAAELQEVEPHAAGLQAIHVPDAGIVDFAAVCRRLAELIEQAGGRIATGRRVQRIDVRHREVAIDTGSETISSRVIVNCAGLYSDRVAQLGGQRPAAKIVPFRGEYFEVSPKSAHLCQNLIYPVPDPTLPFLGVHISRLIDGRVVCGPNAILAFSREGYQWTSLNPRDLFDSVTFPGFLRMTRKHWRTGVSEVRRSLSKRAFVRALQQLVPEIRSEHLKPAPAGVRAQALFSDGRLADDFLIIESERVLSINNAPSPAATSSLALGESIAERVLFRL